MPFPGAVDASAVDDADVGYDGLNAYVAMPRDAGAHPGIIVVHELFGIVEHIRDVARRFANLGYIAIAPNLYSRIGDPEKPDLESSLPKLAQLDDSAVAQDLAATADYVRGRNDSSGKVGCIGFCSGGRATLIAAATTTAFDAAVDCWGGFISRANANEERTPLRPVPAVELARNLNCPTLAVFGAEDDNPSPADSEALATSFALTGGLGEVRVFDAGHAFFADYRPSYRDEAAHALWAELVPFFEAHLH